MRIDLGEMTFELPESRGFEPKLFMAVGPVDERKASHANIPTLATVKTHRFARHLSIGLTRANREEFEDTGIEAVVSDMITSIEGTVTSRREVNIDGTLGVRFEAVHAAPDGTPLRTRACVVLINKTIVGVTLLVLDDPRVAAEIEAQFDGMMASIQRQNARTPSGAP